MEYYIDNIKEYLKSSAVKCLLTDKDFYVHWTNSEQFSTEMCGKNARILFDKSFTLPKISCFSSGVCNGFPYLYKITILADGGFAVEMISENTFLDLIGNTATRNIFDKMNSNIRTSISNICTHSTILYDILQKSENYYEIEHLNIQRGNCYKILSSLAIPSEAVKYKDEIYTKMSIVSINSIFDEFKNTFEASFKTDLMRFEINSELYACINRERLIYTLIEIILSLAENEIISANIKAEKTGDFIYITCSKKTAVQGKEKFHMFSPNETVTYNGDNDFFLSNLFCKHFSSELFVRKIQNRIISVGLKIPFAEPDLNQLILSSHELSYGANNFSPIHVAFSEYFDYEYYSSTAHEI